MEEFCFLERSSNADVQRERQSRSSDGVDRVVTILTTPLAENPELGPRQGRENQLCEKSLIEMFAVHIINSLC